MIRLMFTLLFVTTALQAQEAPVCKKCQLIREYNAAHPENNYYWYDDYLQEKGLDKNGNKVDENSSKKQENKNLLSGCKKCKDNNQDRPFDWNV